MSNISTRRRSVIRGSLALLGGSVTAGCTSDTNLVEEVQGIDPGQESQSDPLKQTFRTSGFSNVEWSSEEDSLRITLEEDHQMQVFGIAHEYEEGDVEKWMGTWEAPNFGGTVEVPFFKVARAHSERYPTRNFTLIGYKGTTGGITWVEERTSSTNFTVPKTVAPGDLFDDIATESTESSERQTSPTTTQAETYVL